MMNGRGFRSYQAMNMVHRTNDGNEIWLGDYTAASNISLLRSKNITNVLTSAAMLDISYTKQHNINHKIINAFDIPTYKMAQHFQQGFKFIDQSLKKGNILVHCAAGISRSTTLVLVYLMRAHHMSFQHALGYVRSKRAVVCPNYGFQNQLKKFELQIRKQNPVFKDKQFKEQQTTTLDYNTFKDKKAVFDFMGDTKKRPLGVQYKSLNHPSQKKNSKGYNTLSGSQGLRGKSYKHDNRDNMQISSDYKSNINKLARGLMSYKVEIPRLVTMKK